MKYILLALLLCFKISALTIEQEAIISYVEIMLVNYFEHKSIKEEAIKNKIRDIIDSTNDKEILSYIYEIVSGLTLIYNDNFADEIQRRLEKWHRSAELSLSDILKQQPSDQKQNS